MSAKRICLTANKFKIYYENFTHKPQTILNENKVKEKEEKKNEMEWRNKTLFVKIRKVHTLLNLVFALAFYAFAFRKIKIFSAAAMIWMVHRFR